MTLKTYAPSFLLLLLTGLAACGGEPDARDSIEDPEEATSEIGTRSPPRAIAWSVLDLPRGGLEGTSTIDDVAFLERPDGAPVTRMGGKAIMYVLERVGMRRLPRGDGESGWSDPGVALLLRSDDGGGSFQTIAQLPGLGYPAKLHLGRVARGAPLSPSIYVEAPGEDTGLRGGLASYHATLMRSDDGGGSWTTLPGGIGDVVVDPANAQKLSGVDCRGFVTSADAGATWSVVTRTQPTTSCESAHLVRTSDPNQLYAVFHVGELGFPTLWRSNDAGVTFGAVQQETNAHPRSDFTADPLDANHLWTSDYFGFASSANGGKSFAPHNRGLLSYGEAQGAFALSDVAIDDFHRPPGGEKHTLWMLNADRVMRWSPESGPENGQWKRVSTLPGEHSAGKRFILTGRASAPKPYAVMGYMDGSEVLVRGDFAY